MIKWIVVLATRHRAVFTASCAIVLMVSVFVSSRLPTRLDMDDFLPARDGSDASFEAEIRDLVGGSARIVIYIESASEMQAGEVGPVIDELATRLRRIEGISSVRGHLDPGIRRFLDEEGPKHLLLYLKPDLLELAAEKLTQASIQGAFQPKSDEGEAILNLFVDARERDPLGVGVLAARTIYQMAGSSPIRIVDEYFSLPGQKIFFLVVEPSIEMGRLEKASALVSGINSVFRDLRSDPELGAFLDGKRLSAIGRPISYVAATELVFGDVRRVGFAATITVLILLGLFFRSVLAPFIILLPIVFGLAITGVVAFTVFGSISLIAWAFAGILVGLGVDFSLHIASHYWLHTDAAFDREAALLSAVVRPGRSIFFAGLTSAAAFLSLAIISYPVMKQVALLTGIGLLVMLLGSFTVLVLGLGFSKPSQRSVHIWNKWSSFLANLALRKPAPGLLFWIALIGSAAVVSSSIQYETHPWNLALKGNPKTAEMDRLNDQLGSSFSPILVVSKGATLDEAMRRDRSAVDVLRRGAERSRIVSIESVSNWLPIREDQEANIEFVRSRPELFSPTRFRIDYDAALASSAQSGSVSLNEYLLEEYPAEISRFLRPNLEAVDLGFLRKSGLGSELNRFLFQAGGKHVVVSYVYLRQFPWAKGSVSRFLETYEMLGGDELEGVQLMGDALRSDGHSSILRRDLAVASILSAFLVLVILWVQFRRLSRIIICLLPAICGMAAALLVMAILQIELNLFTLAIAPILIGLGVDDGIHIVQRLHSGQSLELVFQEAGSSMTMTTLTTVGAFACLGFARFDGIQELGLVGGIGLLVCLFASLHLVPVCYRLIFDRAPAG